MKETPIRIIQLSDLHLFGDSNSELLGVNTRESFEAVVALIENKTKEFDVILITGDLSQDNSENSYLYPCEALKKFNVPIYSIPGNHDEPKTMEKLYRTGLVSTAKHIIIGNWQIILLNTHKHGAVKGFVDPQEMKFLRKALEEHQDKFTILAFHHQPLPVGSAWLDNLGVENAKDFWKLITSYPQVKALFFGHVHQVFEKEQHGIKCYSAPSTCFQFKRNQDVFGIEKLGPGFRWINLYPDGRIETGIERTREYIGEFQADAKGY